MLIPMFFHGRPQAMVASVVLVASLSACSGGDGTNSDYCKDLEASKSTLQSLNTGDSQLLEAIEVSHRLTAEAPGSVEDAWKAVDKVMTGVEEGLKEAGVGPKEYAQLQRGEVPDGVDQEKLRGLPARVQRLDGPAVEKARKSITDHARDVCKVNFAS
jgi:hypothetical protein